MSSGNGRLDNTGPVQSVVNSQVTTADAVQFHDALKGTVPVGELDQTVQEQLRKLRNVMNVGPEGGSRLDFADKVVNGIKNVQEKLDGNLSRIEGQIVQHLQLGSLDPGQLVALQFKVAMFSFELEMANGIVHKSGQHVDTFLRSQ
ncbi:MAG: hypothetical protein P8077_08995 [Gammaproteobacteria bacterium]